MPQSCAAYNCTNRRGDNKDGVRSPFHRYYFVLFKTACKFNEDMQILIEVGSIIFPYYPRVVLHRQRSNVKCGGTHIHMFMFYITDFF